MKYAFSIAGALATMVVLPTVLTASPNVQGESRRATHDELPIATLKRAYLACDDAAMQRRLDGADAMQCSMVYEALKRRAFDGDFGQLLAWSRSAGDTAAGAAP